MGFIFDLHEMGMCVCVHTHTSTHTYVCTQADSQIAFTSLCTSQRQSC